jgi:hypothetical protein
MLVASESFKIQACDHIIIVTIVGLLTLMPLCHMLADHGVKQSTN